MFVFVGRAAQPLPGATLDPGPVGQRHWKLDHALRTVVNAGGALADEHGLGTGRASNEKAFSDESLAYVVETLIDSRRSARDRSVYRSRMNKLVRWARDFEVDVMATPSCRGRGFADRLTPRDSPTLCVKRPATAAPDGSFRWELPTKLPTKTEPQTGRSADGLPFGLSGQRGRPTWRRRRGLPWGSCPSEATDDARA